MNSEHKDPRPVSEKDKLFQTINDFISTSGFITSGIKAITSNITSQVNESKNKAKKKVIFITLGVVGLAFAFVGLMQIITFYLGIELYTNLIIGLLFLFAALLVKAFGD